MSELNIKTIKGIEVGLGQEDALVEVSQKLEAQYQGHLILVQAGTFLHAYNKSAYALHVLKKYALKLKGPAKSPHLVAGFPVANFKQRLWDLSEEYHLPYVVALGTQEKGYELNIINHDHCNSSVLDSVSDDIVNQIIADLVRDKQLKTATTYQALSNPDTTDFMLKVKAQELDSTLLQDIIKLPRDIRATWGENVRETSQRIMRAIYLYGNADNKPQLLKQLSADIDLLKHYITQAQRLSRFNLAFEHRVVLIVELGRIAGGLLRSKAMP